MSVAGSGKRSAGFAAYMARKLGCTGATRAIAPTSRSVAMQPAASSVSDSTEAPRSARARAERGPLQRSGIMASQSSPVIASCFFDSRHLGAGVAAITKL
jgi:hypothetical protein